MNDFLGIFKYLNIKIVVYFLVQHVLFKKQFLFIYLTFLLKIQRQIKITLLVIIVKLTDKVDIGRDT